MMKRIMIAAVEQNVARSTFAAQNFFSPGVSPYQRLLLNPYLPTAHHQNVGGLVLPGY